MPYFSTRGRGFEVADIRTVPVDPDTVRHHPWTHEPLPWLGHVGGPVHVNYEPFDIYIGRKGHGFDDRPEAGVFGNPIVLGVPCPVCHESHRRAGETLACYEVWLDKALAQDSGFRAQVANLQGLRLGCFCGPLKACHGHLLLERAYPDHDKVDLLDGLRARLAGITL